MGTVGDRRRGWRVGMPEAEALEIAARLAAAVAAARGAGVLLGRDLERAELGPGGAISLALAPTEGEALPVEEDVPALGLLLARLLLPEGEEGAAALLERTGAARARLLVGGAVDDDPAQRLYPDAAAFAAAARRALAHARDSDTRAVPRSGPAPPPPARPGRRPSRARRPLVVLRGGRGPGPLRPLLEGLVLGLLAGGAAMAWLNRGGWG